MCDGDLNRAETDQPYSSTSSRLAIRRLGVKPTTE